MKVVEILFEDLDSYFNKESEIELVELILKNTRRYVKLFCEAIDKIMPQKDKRFKDEESEEIEDIILRQREQNLENNPEGNSKSDKSKLPPEIKRR